MSRLARGRVEGGRTSASNGIGRRARITAARPAIRIGGPTVAHGMRWVGLDAACVTAFVGFGAEGGFGGG